MIFQMLCTSLLATAIYYLRFAYKRANYWREQGVPGPKNPLFVGFYDRVFDPSTPWMLEIPKMTEKYGKLWGYNEGVHRVLVVADPAIAHQVYYKRFEEFQTRRGSHISHPSRHEPVMGLLSARGERWKRIHSVSSPMFANSSLKKLMDPVGDSSDQLIKHLSEMVGKGSFNIHRYFQEFSMDVIGRLALGETKSVQWETDLVDVVKSIFDKDHRDLFTCLALMFPAFRQFFRHCLSWKTAYLQNDNKPRLVEKVREAIERRRKSQVKDERKTADDFIDMFLEAEVANAKGFLTEGESIGGCYTFLLAGFDTTANSLSYATDYLARHAEIRKRLREEILNESIHRRPIQFDDLSEMKYLDSFVKEVLRLHPLATHAMARVVENDCELAEIKIEKGTIIQIDAFSLQKDKEIWGNDADEFIPERWFQTTREQNQCFLAFGGGPRACIGKRLAVAQMKMALAKVILNYEVTVPEGAQGNIETTGAVIVAPKRVDVLLNLPTIM